MHYLFFFLLPFFVFFSSSFFLFGVRSKRVGELLGLLLLGLVPAVVHLEFSAEHRRLRVRLVDAVDARLAFVEDELTVEVDVAD